LAAHLTPGHSKGNTTWTMVVQEDTRKYDVVFAGSPNINDGVTLVNNPKYPTITADYEKTFRVLKALPCDVFLSGHGSAFMLAEKTQRMQSGSTSNSFIDPDGYRAFLERTEHMFRQQLQRERLNAKP